MPEKKSSIPINYMSAEHDSGIALAKATSKDLALNTWVNQAHRDHYHSFALLTKGKVVFEIDFKRYKITGPSLIYIQPGQVHRIISVESSDLSMLIMNNENLNPEYLKILLEIAPVKPLKLKKDSLLLLSETIALGIKFYERKHEKLFHSVLKDICNALVAQIASLYLVQSGSRESLSRFEIITRSFKSLLERDFTISKRPGSYAQKLNISTIYLNECVKKSTGHPVSYHIQERIVLEAKRLLYHSNKSVKEIASELGYDDYPYFSRFFTKSTGMTALAFRNKNHD
jgi:AraC family transcriptional activator of pobA